MTTPAHKIHLSIPAASEFIAVARLTVSGISSRMNFAVNDIEDIKVALSEACTNVIQHAYEPDQQAMIDIDFHLFPDRLEIIVQDQGRGFNTQHIKSPKIDSDNPELFGLGLGLVFIQSLMDEASIDSEFGKGTTLKMIKSLPKVTA